MRAIEIKNEKMEVPASLYIDCPSIANYMLKKGSGWVVKKPYGRLSWGQALSGFLDICLIMALQTSTLTRPGPE